MKKNLILLIGIVCFGTASFSQSNSNAERIEQIQPALDRAVNNGNYEKAAELKREKEIRLDIEQALQDGDFERAARLKDELDGNGSSPQNHPQQDPVPSTREDEPNDSGIRVEDGSSQTRMGTPVVEKREPPKKQNRITDNGTYFDVLVGIGSFTSPYRFNSDYYNSGYGYNYSYQSSSTVQAAIGFAVGNKYYFGKDNQDRKVRMGLDMKWATFNGIIPDPAHACIGFVNPGFAFAMAFNDHIGLEANFNLGLTLLTDERGGDPGFGIRLGPQVKFRFRTLSAGLDFNFSRAANEEFSARIFGFTAGFKF